jgi:hypothetical protein
MEISDRVGANAPVINGNNSFSRRFLVNLAVVDSNGIVGNA